MGRQVRGLEPDQWRRAGEILAMLGAKYPIFRERPLKPLAIGIGSHLSQSAAEMNLSEADIHLAMVRLTRSRSYLNAIAEGGARYDLDGEIAGEVKPTEARFAQTIIARRKARDAAIKAGQRSGEECPDAVSKSTATTRPDDGVTRLSAPEGDAAAGPRGDHGDKAA